MANEIDINAIRSTLHGLIETLKEGEEGFRAAAEKLNDAAAAGAFRRFAGERAKFAGELKGALTRLGPAPRQTAPAPAALHRGWVNLKAALDGGDDRAILNEAERGEDATLENYRAALAFEMTADIHILADRQYREILNAHNSIRMWRDSMKNVAGAARS